MEKNVSKTKEVGKGGWNGPGGGCASRREENIMFPNTGQN